MKLNCNVSILRDPLPTDGGQVQTIAQQAKTVIDALTPIADSLPPYGPLVVLGANAVVAFVPSIVKEVEALFASGEISAEQQQAILDAFNTLRAQLPTMFSGPEWKQIPVKSPDAPTS